MPFQKCDECQRYRDTSFFPGGAQVCNQCAGTSASRLGTATAVRPEAVTRPVPSAGLTAVGTASSTGTTRYAHSGDSIPHSGTTVGGQPPVGQPGAMAVRRLTAEEARAAGLAADFDKYKTGKWATSGLPKPVEAAEQEGAAKSPYGSLEVKYVTPSQAAAQGFKVDFGVYKSDDYKTSIRRLEGNAAANVRRAIEAAEVAAQKGTHINTSPDSPPAMYLGHKRYKENEEVPITDLEVKYITPDDAAAQGVFVDFSIAYTTEKMEVRPLSPEEAAALRTTAVTRVPRETERPKAQDYETTFVAPKRVYKPEIIVAERGTPPPDVVVTDSN